MQKKKIVIVIVLVEYNKRKQCTQIFRIWSKYFRMWKYRIWEGDRKKKSQLTHIQKFLKWKQLKNK